jgi:hypothetical protein
MIRVAFPGGMEIGFLSDHAKKFYQSCFSLSGEKPVFCYSQCCRVIHWHGMLYCDLSFYFR